MKSVDYDAVNKILLIKFSGKNFDKKLALVKGLVGSTFIMNGKFWTAPALDRNIENLFIHKWKFTETAKALLFKEKKEEVKIDESLISELYPFQIKGVRWLEQNDGTGIIADLMGAGKTVQAVSYAKLHPQLRPVLVFCPATIKLQWKNEIKRWTGENKVLILYGRTSHKIPKNKYNWIIVNYDILGEEEVEIDEFGKPILKKNGKPSVHFTDYSWIHVLVQLNIKIVICDEAQALSHDSGRTRAVQYFRKLNKDCKFIALSGTPIRNRPLEFFNILNMIAPSVFSSSWKFKQRYCGPKHNGFGWTFKGATNLDELHELVKPYMIRREIEEVIAQLPPKIISIVPLELEEIELANYNNAEEKFKEWLKSNYKNFATIQNQMERLKQLAYLAKRNSVFKWIEEFLSTGNKLVVMTYHRMAMDDIYGNFKNKAVKLDGTTNQLNRQKAIDDFQKKDEIRLFVGQIIAAGVGVDGLQNVCNNMAFVEFTYTPADHAQAQGRLQRISKEGKYADFVNIYYLVADGTIDNMLVSMIVSKHKVTKQVLDGKTEEFFDGQDLNLVEEMTEKYMRAK